MTEFEPTIITKPEQIATFHLMQLRSALGLELRSGMKFSNKGDVARHAVNCGYTSFDKDAPPKRITRADRIKIYGELDEKIIAAGGMARPLPDSVK